MTLPHLSWLLFYAFTFPGAAINTSIEHDELYHLIEIHKITCIKVFKGIGFIDRIQEGVLAHPESH
jgi:hypothetical protein